MAWLQGLRFFAPYSSDSPLGQKLATFGCCGYLEVVVVKVGVDMLDPPGPGDIFSAFCPERLGGGCLILLNF